MAVKNSAVKTTFTNVLFVVGVGLMIFGFISGSLTVARLLTFENYPLSSYEETRCELEITRPVAIDGDRSTMMEDSEKAEQSKQRCIDAVEHQRNVKKTQDIVASLSTFIAGGVLVLSFKRFILKD